MPKKEQSVQATTKVESPTKAVVVEETIVYEPHVLKCSGSKTIGKSKSNKPWKEGSTRAAMQKRSNPKSWAKKMEDKKKMQSLRARITELREEKRNTVSRGTI
jgi:hypothetical protein